jgi:hypothetical protein
MDYTQKKIGESTFEQHLREIRTGYDEQFSPELLSKMAEIILNNPDYTGPEYRLLCWLITEGIMKNPGINIPFIPLSEDIEEISMAMFETRYVTSDARRDLYAHLQVFIERFKQKFGISEELTLLIGGGFTDVEREMPKDIDGIILIPDQIWQRNSFRFLEDFIKQSDPVFEKKEFDFKTAPVSFDYHHFKGFNDISLLANNTSNRDKGERMSMNEFVPRKVISIKL